MAEVVIVAACRTPIGKLKGSLATVPSYELGATVMKDVLKRSGVEGKDVSEVIFGQVLTAGAGQNPCRHAVLLAGIPDHVPACLVNQVCGSGLRSIALAYQAIKTGDADIVIAGGQESMTLAPHCMNMRKDMSMGDSTLIDTMMEDGLKDAIGKYVMGETAENVAQQYQINRQQQDEFAYSSQMKAKEAAQNGKFNQEITPVPIITRKGTVMFETDEYTKPDTSMESLSRLRPCFTTGRDKSQCTVTAGNCTGLNDGASALLLMNKQEAIKRGISVMGRVVTWAHAGVDPKIMGIGPIPAIKKALTKANWCIDNVDLFEINEAFASQSLAIVKELDINPEKVNVNGGSIALGHPIGSSGARIVVTLLHAMIQRNVKRGIAALCVGGGMGVALCVER